MKKIFLTIFSLTITCSLLTNTARAQTSLSNITTQRLPDELSVNINPNYPKPLEPVTLSLEMYTENLDSATISYYVNGVLVKKGKGLKTFFLTMGGVGVTENIEIRVALQSGVTFSKNISLVGAGMDIMIQSDSYTPAFYRGKSLFGPQSKVRLIANPYLKPSLSSINSGSDLIYNWSIDGEIDQSISGYGKNAVSIQSSLLGTPTLVEVVATDPVSGVSMSGKKVLVPNQPIILFYEDSPLYGIIYDRAISDKFEMVNDETSIVATPYNTSMGNIYSNQYKWKINNQIAPDIQGRSAIFRKPTDVGGESLVSLEINNPIRYLQYGKASFMIKFDKSNEITN